MSRQHVRKALPLGLAMALFSSVSTAQERLPVPDARPLLLAAIDAPDGRAHGVLSGPIANAITARFKATSPVYIDVSTERSYAQPGCRRLKVSFWQDGVQLPGEPGPRRRTIDFGINYCRDGLPPRSLS